MNNIAYINGVVKECLVKDIAELCGEFYNEMMAEMAWCAHCYATEYFADFRLRTIELLNNSAIKETENAKRALFALRTDYNYLISKVYGNEKFTSEEKEDIADGLNEMFKTRLADAMESIAEIYKTLTGKEVNIDE